MLSQDGTLSIAEVSYEQAGQYLCVGAVPSVPGLKNQASVNLTVQGKDTNNRCMNRSHRNRDVILVCEMQTQTDTVTTSSDKVLVGLLSPAGTEES